MTTETGKTAAPALRPRDRDAIVQALRAGVVPRAGARHIQVGRSREIEEMIKDVARIADGGATMRLIIGPYGSGKTFFLNLTRQIALESKLVVLSADLSPDRRLHSSEGLARSLCAELMRSMATRTRPEGGALGSVVERFISDALQEARSAGTALGDIIHRRLAPLQDLVAGFDFAVVLERYAAAHEAGDEAGKAAALRWLRAEYASRTDAREQLGVRTIVDDASVYDHLKLVAQFVRIAGYAGLLVSLDEMVNLYKIQNRQGRDANYEQILRILNDVLQGTSGAIGFVLGGTPEFLMDTRRGLFSYAALQSRLAENAFARQGLVDYSGPVIRLANLTPEDLFVLLMNIRALFAGPAGALPDEALTAFMAHCAKRVGDDYFRTPRTTVTAFTGLLAVIEQNPGADWRALLGAVEIERDRAAGPSGAAVEPGAGDAEEGAEEGVAETLSEPAPPVAPPVAPPRPVAGDDDFQEFVL